MITFGVRPSRSLVLVALAAPIAEAFQNPMPELKSGAVVTCSTAATLISRAAAGESVQSICVQSPLPLKIIGMARCSGKFSIMP